MSPYSLGKLIEWKLEAAGFKSLWGIERDPTPYSLGKLIEWKLTHYFGYEVEIKDKSGTPYSLGKLIEWKQGFAWAIAHILKVDSLLVREIN
jgi:hypothetical protein